MRVHSYMDLLFLARLLTLERVPVTFSGHSAQFCQERALQEEGWCWIWWVESSCQCCAGDPERPTVQRGPPSTRFCWDPYQRLPPHLQFISESLLPGDHVIPSPTRLNLCLCWDGRGWSRFIPSLGADSALSASPCICYSHFLRGLSLSR